MEIIIGTLLGNALGLLVFFKIVVPFLEKHF